MQLTIPKVQAHKVSIAELYTLMILAGNDHWHVHTINPIDSAIRTILVIMSNDPPNDVECLHNINTTFGVANTIFDNTNCKELIELSKQKIWENSDEIIKYTNIASGLLSSSDKHIDIIKLRNKIFTNKSILDLRFDKIVPQFTNIKELGEWIKDNIKTTFYYSDVDGFDVNEGNERDLKNMFNMNYKHIQFMFYIKKEKTIDLNVYSSSGLEG